MQFAVFCKDRRLKTQKSDQASLSDFFVLIRNQIALDVESGRVELPSRQATKELSTRLFPDWFFVVMLGREQPHNAYLLKLSG
jgi:hypothetical protein